MCPQFSICICHDVVPNLLESGLMPLCLWYLELLQMAAANVVKVTNLTAVGCDVALPFLLVFNAPVQLTGVLIV
jgi:hypothetical protein